MTAAADEACPWEWAEYNLPHELLPQPGRAVLTPFARRALVAAGSARAWPFVSTERPGELRLGSLLAPGLGLRPFPKP